VLAVNHFQRADQSVTGNAASHKTFFSTVVGTREGKRRTLILVISLVRPEGEFIFAIFTFNQSKFTAICNVVL
jgi:hypothetical protein